jgi:uncharacterized protein (DUF697 family)
MSDPSEMDELATAVAGLAESDLDKASRARLLGRLVGGLKARGVKELFAPRKALGWIIDAVSDLAPHVPVRTLPVLRAHFPGLEGDELADRLIRNAARATAGVGALGGGIASVEWAAPPALLTLPVLLAVETVAVVAIELKLIGELHEAYGHSLTGSTTQKAVTLMQSWAGRRGVNPMIPGSSIATVLGTATRKQLRDMILKRFGRNLTTLGPFLTGAAIASYLNKRQTRKLGEEVTRDLRLRYASGQAALPPAPPGDAS